MWTMNEYSRSTGCGDMPSFNPVHHTRHDWNHICKASSINKRTQPAILTRFSISLIIDRACTGQAKPSFDTASVFSQLIAENIKLWISHMVLLFRASRPLHIATANSQSTNTQKNGTQAPPPRGSWINKQCCKQDKFIGLPKSLASQRPDKYR